MTTVKVTDHFDEYGLQFDEAMRRALVKGAEATRDVAERNAPKGATHRLEETIRISALDSTPSRYRIVVYAGMFYGRFLEFGTLGSRRRKLKRPGARVQAAPPGSGIKPRYFMLRSGREAAPAFREAIREELRRL